MGTATLRRPPPDLYIIIGGADMVRTWCGHGGFSGRFRNRSTGGAPPSRLQNYWSVS